MKEVTWEETLPDQYHKVTVLKCQVFFAQLKTINLAARNKSLWYSFPFSANFHVVFIFTKSKPRREQLVITKNKNKQKNNPLTNCIPFYETFGLSQSQILSFGPGFFVYLFLSVVVSAELSVLKEWRNVFLHVSRMYWFLKPLSPVVLPSVTS